MFHNFFNKRVQIDKLAVYIIPTHGHGLNPCQTHAYKIFLQFIFKCVHVSFPLSFYILNIKFCFGR